MLGGVSVSVEKKVYTVKEIMNILGIRRKKAYDLVKEGHFAYKKLGRDIRINKESFDKWFNDISKE